MRRPLALVLAGVLALVLAGALSASVGSAVLPDVALLAALAAGLCLGPAEGLVVAAAVGLLADTLSGSLLGQQACLGILAFAATRIFTAQLDLRRPLPLAVFVLALAVADALGMAATTRLFLGRLAFSASQLPPLALHALVTAAAAPLVAVAARRLLERMDETESRREMRLDTRRPVL